MGCRSVEVLTHKELLTEIRGAVVVLYLCVKRDLGVEEAKADLRMYEDELFRRLKGDEPECLAISKEHLYGH